jgi:hypothetical protein
MFYSDAILSLDPTYQFVSSGNDYNSIEWYDSREKPSKEILDEQLKKLKVICEKDKYKDSRKHEYPEWNVLADAIYHQQKGDSSKMDQYIKMCDEVKQKYPKG